MSGIESMYDSDTSDDEMPRMQVAGHVTPPAHHDAHAPHCTTSERRQKPYLQVEFVLGQGGLQELKSRASHLQRAYQIAADMLKNGSSAHGQTVVMLHNMLEENKVQQASIIDVVDLVSPDANVDGQHLSHAIEPTQLSMLPLFA
jgi:hypothetical protein